MSTRYDAQDPAQRSAGIADAVEAIRDRQCIVLPTDTVYGIGADAFSAQAVAVLLAAKGRSRATPPPVLMAHPRVLDALADDIPNQARALADAFWPGALTLILNAQPSLTWDLGETHGTVGLRVPDDELARDILEQTGPMAVSSANRHGQPAATSAIMAQEALGESVAVYLDGGDRQTQAPSTIVDCTVSPLRLIRAGAISIDTLREVVEDLLDVGESAPDAPDDTTQG
ncbi:L-threonylcarbamoyladenylate synthase [Auritidibacter ignavus]|uniref:L-threonylcarbamoyladenylate synthase n=1 Tax=Auritidibacter ignavus TaxID=678932 RepID=UPI0024B9E81C|nr:L-threonylcarbamoyladenylate synthase [Auritidibacter ignavus]WHS35180.1 L-threonylcarbamoyladenylate synthase [Auritidibacter ignavus]